MSSKIERGPGSASMHHSHENTSVRPYRAGGPTTSPPSRTRLYVSPAESSGPSLPSDAAEGGGDGSGIGGVGGPSSSTYIKRSTQARITGGRAEAACAGMARGADLVTELVLNHQLLELALENASSLDLRFGRDAVGVRLWCTRVGGPRQPPPRQRSRRGVSRPRRTGRMCRPRAWGRAGAAA